VFNSCVKSCVCACVCLKDQHQKGNIFTLFLHSPLMAFCHVVNIVDVPVSLWDKCLTVVDKFIADASRLLSRSRTLGKSMCAYYAPSTPPMIGVGVLSLPVPSPSAYDKGLLLLHPFNGLFSRTAWVSRHQKGKPFWILMKQEMMGWHWHQLDHMQIICTSLQTDNHASTSPQQLCILGLWML